MAHPMVIPCSSYSHPVMQLSRAMQICRLLMYLAMMVLTLTSGHEKSPRHNLLTYLKCTQIKFLSHCLLDLFPNYGTASREARDYSVLSAVSM